MRELLLTRMLSVIREYFILCSHRRKLALMLMLCLLTFCCYRIIGLSDGLTVPFALTAGLSSLGESKLVVLGGVAELIAGAISMGVGGFRTFHFSFSFLSSTSHSSISQ